MHFGNRLKNPKVLRPMAMAFLALAISWPVISRHIVTFGPDWADGLRGLLFGVSIGLSVVFMWRRAGRRTGSSVT